MITFNKILFLLLLLAIIGEIIAVYDPIYTFQFEDIFSCIWTMAFSVCLIVCIYFTPSKKLRSKNNIDKSLTDCNEFRLCILVPVTLSFLSYILLVDGGYLTISNYRFAEILDQFKIPIAALGTSIPLTALFATSHRSQQTAAQLEAQRDQNNFINHFKHLEEFKKAFEGYSFPYPWKSSEDLHRAIYPRTRSGKLDPYPLVESPRDILGNLLEQIYLHPFKAQKICNQHYEFATKGMSPISPSSPKDIIPTDFVLLYQTLNKAHTFAALHPPRFDVSDKLEIKLTKLTEMFSSVSYLVSHRVHVLNALKGDHSRSLFTKDNTELALMGQLNIHQGVQEDFLLLAIAQAWLAIVDDMRTNEDETSLISSLPDGSQKFIIRHVHRTYDLDLGEIIKESRRLLVTNKAPSEVTY